METNQWEGVRSWASNRSTQRSWAIAANDGIIATAGVLEGFAGAGAGDRLLFFASIASAIAGALSTGGAQWAEDAAERESQVRITRLELAEITADPEGEFQELVTHWQQRGLDPSTARTVAQQLSAHDQLRFQLEWEYGFGEPMPRLLPLVSGVATALAYTLGALIPVLITFFAPVAIETWAILGAVLVALVITSVIAARSSHLSVRLMLTRSVIVGAATIGVSYAVGRYIL